MSTFVNNGNFRNSVLTLVKRINGAVAPGWPKSYNILNAFGSFPAITQQQFATITNGEYNARLTAFMAFVNNDNPEFDLAQINIQGVAFGTDTVACPISNVAPAVPTVVQVGASMQPLTGGENDVWMDWSIRVSEPVTQPTPYFFDVEIRSVINGSVLNTVQVSGVIPAGSDRHDSRNDNYYIYISEADQPPFQVNPVALINTVNLG